MNIEIIDRWLNEEYGVSYTDLEELHNRLVDKNIELEKKYTQALEVAQDRFDRIDKAIEYIEQHRIGNEYSYEYDLFQRNARTSDLLDILKGSEENDK